MYQHDKYTQYLINNNIIRVIVHYKFIVFSFIVIGCFKKLFTCHIYHIARRTYCRVILQDFSVEFRIVNVIHRYFG